MLWCILVVFHVHIWSSEMSSSDESPQSPTSPKARRIILFDVFEHWLRKPSNWRCGALDKTWLGGWCLHLFSMFQSAIRMILVDDFFGSATALRKGGRTGARTARQPHGCISWAAFKTAILPRDSRARLNWFMLAKAKNDIAMDCFFVCCFLVFQPGFMALVAFVAFVFSAP